MKHLISYIALICSCMLLVVLCACTQTAQPLTSNANGTDAVIVSAEDIDTSHNASIVTTMPTKLSDTTTLSPEEIVSSIMNENKNAPVYINPVQVITDQSVQGDMKYHLSLYGHSQSNPEPLIHAVTGFESDEQHIIVQSILAGYQQIEVRLLDIENHINIPNAITLSIAEGFTDILFGKTSSKISNIEVLELPSTLRYIRGNRNSNNDLFDAFPIELTMLKEIHVNLEGEYYKSENGVLYETQTRYIYDTYKQRLVAVPQNYSTDDQTLHLADGTDEIATGAIYHCRNLQKVVISDNIIKIQDHAIIATAEHPLTVVCSRNSAAAEYVAQFGEMYHLTAEYTD